MQPADGRTRLTIADGVITVESDSLYVAMTTLAQQVRHAESFSIHGRRADSATWEVRATVDAVAIPAQRQPVTYEPCGCLANDQGAHRGDCPDFVTRQGVGGRYWTRRDGH